MKQRVKTCLDVPCGNGRNIFFLAHEYRDVTGIDKEPKYLEAIMQAAPFYTRVPALIERKDILNEGLTNLADYDLICNIHFYHPGLLSTIIAGMKSGAYLIVETPNCHGGNYQDLPSENELTEIIGANTLIELHFNPCGDHANSKVAGSARLLIKKN